MLTTDFAPLFRSSIGFDRLVDLMDAATRGDSGGYPPYNIERTGEDSYRITLAVAGFDASEINITAQANGLVVTGKHAEEANGGTYFYRGIAGRSFERRFQLADYIKVSGANLKNGLLTVELVREVPEAMRPRQIKVETADAETATVAEKAAA